MEAETQALRAEVERLRQQPARLPAVPVIPTGVDPTVSPTAPAAAPYVPAAAPEGYYTMDELRGEMKKFAWTKGDLTIVPYGWLWGNMVYSTEPTTPGTYTLYVPSATNQAQGQFITDVRNTRLGFDVIGPPIPFFCNAVGGGRVEIDFQSPLTTLGTEQYDNKATIMLRHAYAEVKNDDFRLLVGQTWDVISPLNPDMLMYSVGWDAGNIGYRRAQVRLERFLAFSDVSLVTAEISANETVFPDSITSVTGEIPNWPIIEGRVAWTVGHRGKGDQPITVGLSGHIGQSEFNYTGSPEAFNVDRRTWSGNFDIRVPVTERLGFQAEAFTGENLSSFLGGIGQGINPTTRDGIRDSGGWFEVWYDWTACLHSHVGYSLDDPNDHDLSTGERSYNQFYWGNLTYDISKQLLVGLEVSSWKTLYIGDAPGNSVRSEFVLKYGF